MKIFYPEQYVDSVMNVDYKKLWDQGVRLLLFDVDNTLATYNTALPDRKTRDMIQNLKDQGFQVLLVSNGGAQRVERFAAALEVYYIYRALKPLPVGIHRALRRMNRTAKEAALIGDQVFTDVWGGNWAGVHTVLTQPISTIDDEWITRIKRGLEQWYLKKEGLVK